MLSYTIIIIIGINFLKFDFKMSQFSNLFCLKCTDSNSERLCNKSNKIVISNQSQEQNPNPMLVENDEQITGLLDGMFFKL